MLESASCDYRFFTSWRRTPGILHLAAVEAISKLDELPTLTAATGSDRCPNCGAQMAPDQRYCVNCGERRSGGGLRDALPRTQTVATATTPPPTRTTWFSSSSGSLIAGVATLLIALGVGVLIGRTGDHNTPAAARQPVQVVTVAGGAAGGSTTGTSTAASTTSSASSKHSSKASKTKATAVQKTAAKNGVKLPPTVVKVGGKCTKGSKGCSGGKFTGNFFGGG
jgi:zinc-ribbon domain